MDDRAASLACCLLIGLIAACDGGQGSDAGAARDAGPGRDAGFDAGPSCEPMELPDPLTCNGHAELCGRRFDEVAYPTTHNAMSSEADGWVPPNQGFGIWRQLEDGVRGFMLDTYEQDGEALLCHSVCALGSRPLVDALTDFRRFMDCHPTEVITLILEAYLDEAATEDAFEAAGLMEHLHAQPLGEPWPTLEQMVRSGRRMVVLTQDGSASLPWYHHAYTYGWDNDWANETPDDLDCVANRGSADNDLFILNHFLTMPVAMRSLAEMVNHDPFLTERVDACRAEAGRIPNFVTVDFYDVGDLFAAVDHLNGV